jgi:hypothetical protein
LGIIGIGCPIQYDTVKRLRPTYLKVERRGKRPCGRPGTGRARPPRCLVRWQCDSPRSCIISRRSAGRDLGQNSAVPLSHTQSCMIGHPTWGYSATVGDSTAGTSIFPRRRGHARRGALRQEFRGVHPNLGGTAVPGTRGGGYPVVPKFRGYPGTAVQVQSSRRAQPLGATPPPRSPKGPPQLRP